MNDAADVSASTQAFIALSCNSLMIPNPRFCDVAARAGPWRLSHRGMLIAASFAEHPIIADDDRVACLQQLNEAFLDPALERPKSLQRGNRTGAGLDRSEMNEGAVGELQGQIANAFRRFRPQFLKHLLDQARVLLRLLRFGPIAYQGPFH